jgi:hypothetical protein
VIVGYILMKMEKYVKVIFNIQIINKYDLYIMMIDVYIHQIIENNAIILKI